MARTRVVYLLHFSSPISGHAGHYLGSAADLDTRLADHAAGRGARLTQVAIERGITWEVARTWPGGRQEERRLKNQKHSNRLCPLCRAARADRPGLVLLPRLSTYQSAREERVAA